MVGSSINAVFGNYAHFVILFHVQCGMCIHVATEHVLLLCAVWKDKQLCTYMPQGSVNPKAVGR